MSRDLRIQRRDASGAGAPASQRRDGIHARLRRRRPDAAVAARCGRYGRSGWAPALCAFLLSVLPASIAAGQDSPLGLRLVSAATKPGGVAYVNVILANPEGAPVAEFRQRLQFPRDQLAFTNARLGIAASLAGATLTTTLMDGAGAVVQSKDEAEGVELRIVGTKPFPDGPLVELQFQVRATSDATVRLPHKAEALDREGTRMASLAFADGHIVVTSDLAPPPPPAFACFFYMH
jgi:hypothetical protein